MKKYFRFISLIVLIISFFYLLSKIIFGDYVIYTGSIKFIWINVGILFVILFLEQLIDGIYKMLPTLGMISLTTLFVKNNIIEYLLFFCLAFDALLILINIVLFVRNPEKKQFILPPSILRKSQYNTFLAALAIEIALGVDLILYKNSFTILFLLVEAIIIFITAFIFNILIQMPIIRIHKEFILTNDYEKLKDNLNSLKNKHLNLETDNYLDLIIFNYAIDFNKEDASELSKEIFKPSLKQYILLYNQAMTNYYLSNKMYDEAMPLIEELKNSKNKNISFIGKRYDVIIRLEKNEDVKLEEIDEVAKYDNTINTIGTYQLYAKYYEKRDYNKFIEYVQKINQLKNK